MRVQRGLQSARKKAEKYEGAGEGGKRSLKRAEPRSDRGCMESSGCVGFDEGCWRLRRLNVG